MGRMHFEGKYEEYNNLSPSEPEIIHLPPAIY